MKTDDRIKIKTPAEIEILREGGRILARIVSELKRSLSSGMTTKDIDDRAAALIAANGVRAAFKGYRGFPASACISVNQEVVHGIPGDKEVRDGDLVSIDVGIVHRDYYADTAVTVGVGSLEAPLVRLLSVTEEALHRGIARARSGRRLTDISAAVQQWVESNGLSVVRDFVGHGIGRNLHEEPEIPNFGPPGNGPVLREGMVLAIEPMVNIGGWQTRICADGWTVETQDGAPSAHFEHTVLVTAGEAEILTREE